MDYMFKVRGGADTYVKRDGSIGTAGKGALVEEGVSFTLAATQDQTLFQQVGVDVYGDAEKAGRDEVLPSVRKADAPQGLEGRCAGKQPALPKEKVLRPRVHGCGVRDEAEDGQPGVDDRALPCEKNLPAEPVRGMRKEREDGCSPRKRELAGQQGGEPGEAVQELPSESSQGTFGYIVRRLTPLETERLQGFPDDWTDVPYRGKEHAPDTARYKACGNSMAVPVMRWIGERIGMVDEMLGGE